MKEVRVDGKMIPLSLSFETMKPIKTFFFFCTARKEDKVWPVTSTISKFYKIRAVYDLVRNLFNLPILCRFTEAAALAVGEKG